MYAPWLCALFVAIGLSGCATNSRVSAEVPALVAGAPEPAIAAEPDSSLAANAVVRQGRGGYQRTTVPPEFLVLMLGVPVLILLL